MRELRGDPDAVVAKGRDWALSVQRLWPLLEDERHEQTADQAEQKDAQQPKSRTVLQQLLHHDHDSLAPEQSG